MLTINYCPDCGEKLKNNIKFCPGCGKRIHNNHVQNKSLRNKRERVLKGNKKSKSSLRYIAITIILFVAVLVFYINSKPSKEEAVISKQPKVSEKVTYPTIRFDHLYSLAFSKNGKIILPLDVVKEKKFVKFDFVSNNSTIPLLAYLTEDGKIVTAISLCEPCDSKDFHIQGSDLICNSCGTTWDLNNLKVVSGSCGKYPPDPIPSKVVGNEIQIDEYLVTGWMRRV